MNCKGGSRGGRSTATPPPPNISKGRYNGDNKGAKLRSKGGPNSRLKRFQNIQISGAKLLFHGLVRFILQSIYP